MRFTYVWLILTMALLASGCRNDTRQVIRIGDVDLEDVPPGNYPEDDLGTDPSKWTWVKEAERPIQEVMVIPPKMLRDPYAMGEDKDFFGAINGATARIFFKTGGVYVVKIVYQDRSIPPEIRMVYVAAGKSDK
jgi:hypothetical protein